MPDLLHFQDVLTRTYKAGGTITAGQPVGANLQLAVADAHILGIAIHDVVANDVDSYMINGTCEVIAGGAIAPGAYLKVGAAGKFLSANAADFAAGKVVGKNLETAAGADGDKIQGYFYGV